MKKQALTFFSLVLACALSSGNADCSEQKTKEQTYYTKKCSCHPSNHTNGASILYELAYAQVDTTYRIKNSWETYLSLRGACDELKQKTSAKCMATIEHIALQWVGTPPSLCKGSYYAATQVIQKMIDQREQANKEQAVKAIAAEQISVSNHPTTILQERANLQINTQNHANENDGDNKDGYTVLYRS